LLSSLATTTHTDTNLPQTPNQIPEIRSALSRPSTKILVSKVRQAVTATAEGPVYTSLALHHKLATLHLKNLSPQVFPRHSSPPQSRPCRPKSGSSSLHPTPPCSETSWIHTAHFFALCTSLPITQSLIVTLYQLRHGQRASSGERRPCPPPAAVHDGCDGRLTRAAARCAHGGTNMIE
jgi:hypothetical protein